MLSKLTLRPEVEKAKFVKTRVAASIPGTYTSRKEGNDPTIEESETSCTMRCFKQSQFATPNS